MKIAYLNLRHGVPERRAAWRNGLERNGYTVVDVDACGSIRPKRDADIFVSWNRHVDGAQAADRFEAAGCKVLVTENATWGNGFQGGHWYTIGRSYHNVINSFPDGGPERWDALGASLAPFRESHQGCQVVLASRGIGPATHRQPSQWPAGAARTYGARIRHHPGTRGTIDDLRADLAGSWRVITWGSGAAVLALMWGIHVEAHMPGWIARQDNTEAGRLAMLRRLAWAQWRIEEIAAGEPIARILRMK